MLSLFKIKELRVFFDAIDEGGLSYIAKVLELVASTVMISKNFNYQPNTTVSDYYENIAEFFNDIFVCNNWYGAKSQKLRTNLKNVKFFDQLLHQKVY